ncbi:MAG TPA: class I SAM-dependent methyltransferase [Candidatus Acidoferrum sp.]|jgi:SAM-dependent methyltransferase
MSNSNSTNAASVQCPVCESADCLDFLEVSGLPVNVGALCSSREQARIAPKGDLKLAFCKECSYVWNRSYEPGKHEYVPGYEISLHFSPVYQSFLDNLAQHLVEAYRLQKATVLEIACGTGHFLRMLCKLGSNRGIGIDPVLVHEGIEQLDSTEIRFIRDKFSERYADLQYDFVCCRQALHAIENPKDLLQLVCRTIGRERRTPVYFEVVNASEQFRSQNIWQLIYEYYSFFTPASLARLFSVCGFDIRSAQPCYAGGQYLQIEAVSGNGSNAKSQTSRTEIEATLKDVLAFAGGLRDKIARWEEKFEQIHKSGQRVIAWGAGGRGINFLNLVRASLLVPYVVDINPTRCGGFIPGTGQEVVAPEFLREYRPDILLLTNPTYEEEVRKKVEEMHISCEFLTAK